MSVEKFYRYFIQSSTISSVSTFGMTCWGGNAFKPDKNRLSRQNSHKAGGLVGRKQESINTVYHQLMTKPRGQFWLKTPIFDSDEPSGGGL